MLEQRQKSALQGFLDAAPDAIVVVDRAGKIVMANGLTARMFGYEVDALLGRPVEMLVPDRFRAVHERHRTLYAADPRTRPMGEGRELAGRRADGTEFPLEISLSPLDTPEGKWVISIIRDTTVRRQAEAKFRGLLESAPDGIVVVDREGRIVIVNGEIERMFGYGRDELIGRKVEILVPEQYREGHVITRNGYFASPRTRPMGAGRALMGRKRDGTGFPVEISLSPLETEQGTLVMSIVRDITDRRQAEERLEASLREKEVLLKEIHHRVKNNLQITSSLLKLQTGNITDPRTLELFSESQNRIRSMALVHEKLYQSHDLSRIDFADYAKSLASLLFRSYGASGRIDVEVESDPVHFTVDTAIPCGLMLNELLSNAIKHAFPDGRRGNVRIAIVAEQGGAHSIRVRDDGIGLPPEVAIESATTLGLQLVRTLAEQIGATLEVGREGGTEVRILVPAGGHA